MFGLALRHNSLHHLFALFLTLVLASLCWCCWRRGRSYHRRQELLSRQFGRAVTTPSVPSSPPSTSTPAPPTLIPVSARLDPQTAALLPVLSYHTQKNLQSGELSSPETDDGYLAQKADHDDNGSHCCNSSDAIIKSSDCAICISSFDQGTLVTVLPSCGHAYHPSCINQWVQSHKDCPVCRTEISHPTAITLSQ